MECREREISIFKITLKPMRFLMYATAALPFEFNEYHYDVFKVPGTKFWLIIAWRILHLTVSVLFVTWLSMVRLHRYHEVLYKVSDEFSNSVDMVSYGTLLIIYLIVYLENTWKAFHYGKIFENFDSIHFKFRELLKVNVKTNGLKRYAVCLYVLFGFYLSIVLLIIYIRYTKSLNAVRLLVSQYPETVIKLKLMEFGLLVTIIWRLQLHLNSFTINYMLNIAPTEYGPEKCIALDKMAVIQDIHRLLVNSIRHIEVYFLWSLPGILLKMFFEMVYTSYWIYASSDYQNSGYFRLYGYHAIVFQVLMLFVTSCMCSKCELLDKELSSMFHMTKYERHNPIRSRINEISLQLLHEQVTFTAGGFVDVNYRFLGKFILSAICYIVILIQFHMSV